MGKGHVLQGIQTKYKYYRLNSDKLLFQSGHANKSHRQIGRRERENERKRENKGEREREMGLI